MFFTQPEGEFREVDIHRMKNNLPLQHEKHHHADNFHSEQIKAKPFTNPKTWANEMGFFDPAWVDTLEAESQEFQNNEDLVTDDVFNIMVSIQYNYCHDEDDSSIQRNEGSDYDDYNKINSEDNQAAVKEDITFLLSNDVIYSPKFLRNEPTVKYTFGHYDSIKDKCSINSFNDMGNTVDYIPMKSEPDGASVKNQGRRCSKLRPKGLYIDTSGSQLPSERMQNSIRSPLLKPRTSTYSADNHWIGQESPLSPGHGRTRLVGSEDDDQQTKSGTDESPSAILFANARKSFMGGSDRPPFYPPFRDLGIPELKDSTSPTALRRPSALEGATSPQSVRRPSALEGATSLFGARRPSALEGATSPTALRRPSALEGATSPQSVRRPSALESATSLFGRLRGLGRVTSPDKKSSRSGSPRASLGNSLPKSSSPRAGFETTASSSLNSSFFNLMNNNDIEYQGFEEEKEEIILGDSEGAEFFHDINMRRLSDIEAGTAYYTLLFASPDMPSPIKGGALIHWVCSK